MADRDEALHYLLNKLKSEDGWSSANLTWNEEKLSIVADQFSSFDGIAKTKVLLSFLSMTPRTINQCNDEMQQILRLARRDGDEWVRLFAAVLTPFPQSQTVAVDACMEGSMEGVQEEIGEALSGHAPSPFTPHEYAYLNESVLAAQPNYSAPSHTHFTLLRQPQASVQLRNEVLQRAGTDFSQTGSLVKDRHLLQRQLSSAGTSSNPFVPTTRTTSSRKSVPIPGVSSRIQRERGTKLLDLDEVPITTRRKRRAAGDAEARPDSKRLQRTPSKSEPEPPTPTLTPTLTPLPTPSLPLATPDYAAGLGSEYLTPMLQTQEPPSSLDQQPLAPQPQPLTTPPATAEGGATQAPLAARQPTKGLKLSRQQLQIAQDMFRESPSLTREQKALILGFMAGSRENPNPDRNTLTVKLNERQLTEDVPSPEGQMLTRTVLIETVFEMNYSNGQWRKLQFKRPINVVRET